MKFDGNNYCDMIKPDYSYIEWAEKDYAQKQVVNTLFYDIHPIVNDNGTYKIHYTSQNETSVKVSSYRCLLISPIKLENSITVPEEYYNFYTLNEYYYNFTKLYVYMLITDDDNAKKLLYFPIDTTNQSNEDIANALKVVNHIIELRF